MKLFMIILLALFFWFVFRTVSKVFKVISFLRAGFQNPFEAPNSRAHNHAQSKRKPQSDSTTMVKCSACDLYILDDEAVTRNGMVFCSPEHARNSN